MNWQPIDTAPKDEITPILLVSGEWVGIGSWADWDAHTDYPEGLTRPQSRWETLEGFEIKDATHWMPLPEPPAPQDLDSMTGKGTGE